MADEIKLKRAKLIRLYSAAPWFLARQLGYIFDVYPSERLVDVHNHIMTDIMGLCPNREGLCKKVANAIIEYAKATEEPVT